MATNRAATYAPPILCRLSKTTLADLVWELVATAPGVTCDNVEEKWAEVFRAAGRVAAPTADLRTISRARARVQGV
jgi:hypothetical protein